MLEKLFLKVEKWEFHTNTVFLVRVGRSFNSFWGLLNFTGGSFRTTAR